ncbi:putative glycosyltransferase WbpX [Piscinibacter sakaiensis]|uniref:Putative glycosyltransferase WbpX n=2 Tax=Piscinibacter sakaiensis TaxID=1547922 RepID=A0A0K8P7S2_PISS1|nr:putative glycosyltransferase WbpX [Piscinibacter sakaiensis]
MSNRQWAGAASAYRAILRDRPDLAPLRVQLAHALKETGALEAAMQEYRQAAEALPEDADVRMHLGHLALRLGNQEAAQGWLEAAAARQPDAQALQQELGRLRQARAASRDSRPYPPPARRAVLRLLWDLTPLSTDRFDEEHAAFVALAARLEGLVDVDIVRFDEASGDFLPSAGTVSASGRADEALTVFVCSAAGLAPGVLARRLGQAQRRFGTQVLALSQREARDGGLTDAERVLARTCTAALVPRSCKDLWRSRTAEGVPVCTPDFDALTWPPFAPASSRVLIVARPDDPGLAALCAAATSLDRMAPALCWSEAPPAAEARGARGVQPIGTREAWAGLAQRRYGHLLLGHPMPTAALWAEAGALAGCRVHAPADDSVFERLGARAAQMPDLPPAAAARAEADAQAGAVTAAQADAASRVWADAFGAVADRLVLQAASAPGLHTRWAPGEWYALGPAAPSIQRGEAFLAGPGWQLLPEGAQPGASSILRGKVDREGPVVCRAWIMLDTPQGDTKHAWLTVESEARSPVPGAAADATFEISDAAARHPELRVNPRVGGYVVFPADEDHHWFRWLDHLTREARDLLPSAANWVALSFLPDPSSFRQS